MRNFLRVDKLTRKSGPMTGAKKSPFATWPSNFPRTFASSFMNLARGRKGVHAPVSFPRGWWLILTHRKSKSVARSRHVIYWEAFIRWSADGSIKQLQRGQSSDRHRQPAPEAINFANFQFLFLGGLYIWRLTQDSFGCGKSCAIFLAGH